jgi:hypothetical protein
MTPPVQHAFGRRFAPDPDDHKYLMRRRLRAGAPLPSSKTHRIASRSLDQGRTGTCVGHGWTNFLRCAPIQTNKDSDKLRWEIYKAAVVIDEWTDNDTEAQLPNGDAGLQSGTSVRAGAEAVTAKGRLKSYLWAFELQPALEWVLTEGPVVLGVNWYSSFNPDAEGICKITPTARVDGGHCFLWRGANTRRGLGLCENSWGDEWGKNGSFWLPLSDLERLIHEQGEACSAVEQKVLAKTTMPPPQPAAA